MKHLFIALLFLTTFSNGFQAQASEQWLNVISDVENKLEEYIQKSDKLLRLEDELYASINVGPLVYAGNACANCYWPTHQCAILGRMLGEKELIFHLEKPLPPITASLGDVWSAAESLSQWVYTAKRLLALPSEERAAVWNLECVGSFGIPMAAFNVSGRGALSMRVDGSYLWIYGDITDGFYGELVKVLDRHSEIQTVGLGSGGGSVRDAILSGQEIRKRGLNTQLTGPCLSACPLVFIGGKSRNVMRPFPIFGFHQIANVDGEPIRCNDPVYDDVLEYSLFLGVDGEWVVDKMCSAAPHEMNNQGHTIEERDQLCRTGVVTWYQGVGATLC